MYKKAKPYEKYANAGVKPVHAASLKSPFLTPVLHLVHEDSFFIPLSILWCFARSSIAYISASALGWSPRRAAPSPPPKWIHVGKPHDFEIRYTKFEDGPDSASEDGPMKRVTVSKTGFLVKSDIVKRHFKALVEMIDKAFETMPRPYISLEGDNLTAMEIWLRVLHENEENYDKLMNLPVKKLWHLAPISKRYEIDLTLLGNWFAKWWCHRGKNIEAESAAQLMYLCWSFDHPHGYAYSTRRLVYTSYGLIMDDNPHLARHPDRAWQKIPPAALVELNAAKAHLQALLILGLWNPITPLLESATCICKATTVFQYQRLLTKRGVWPVEVKTKEHNMSYLLNCLHDFKFETLGACDGCRSPLRNIEGYEVVQITKCFIRDYFDGQCLDSYWQHDHEMFWDKSCRIQHGTGTWHRSFIGKRRPRQRMRHQVAMDSPFSTNGELLVLQKAEYRMVTRPAKVGWSTVFKGFYIEEMEEEEVPMEVDSEWMTAEVEAKRSMLDLL
ncbi:hypothetical protein EJ06DRAFT_566467 [Trichodelitschia bisporula]|uniref:Uncharacterized protein n=1 Tax=Trichodelitschia bisporula TaxID=703511 RepID=A0A6G1HN92_9PEZI|nr:hypothetical protein EJ06DRAFT_566467 [Trichodelitschia bisporula]